MPSDLMLRPLLGVGERVGLKTPEIHSAEVREGRKTVHCSIRNVAEERGVSWVVLHSAAHLARPFLLVSAEG